MRNNLTSPSRTEEFDPQSDLPIQVVDRTESSVAANRKKRPWLKFGFIGIVLAAGCFVILSREKTAPPPPAPQKNKIYALGRLEPKGEIRAIAAPASSGDARIIELKVKEGSAVEKGSVLAVLDNAARLEQALEQSLRDLAHAEASLNLKEVEVRTQREQLQAAKRASEADLAQTEKNLARYKELQRLDAASFEQLEDAQLALQSAQESNTEANARLARYGEGELRTSPDILLAQSEIELAKAAVIRAEIDLADARILAPLDGTILRIFAHEGEKLGQDPLLEMGNTSEMMARVEVYESEVPKLEKGQSVILSAAPLSQILHGEIASISRLVRRQEIISANPAANTDARIMEVWVRLDPESSALASNFVNLQVRVAFENAKS